MGHGEPAAEPHLTVEALKTAAVEAKQIQVELQSLKVTAVADHCCDPHRKLANFLLTR